MNPRAFLLSRMFSLIGLVGASGACGGTDPSGGVGGSAAGAINSAPLGGSGGAAIGGGVSAGAVGTPGGAVGAPGGSGGGSGGARAAAGGATGGGAAGSGIAGSGTAGGGTAGSGTMGGGTAGGGSAESPHATYAAVASQILHSTCTGAGCHGGETAPQLVIQRSDSTFDDAAVYTTLTTFKATKCGNRVLVKPNAPEESALYLVVTGKCEVATVMPFGCTPDANDPFNGSCIPNLSDPSKPVSYMNPTSIEDLRQWIAKGAPQN